MTVPWPIRKGDRSGWGRRAREEVAFQNSLHHMAAVMAPPEDFPPTPEGGDQLMRALDLIGRYEGLRFEEAGDSSGDWAEQIARICEASHLRYRQVTLRGNWFRRPSVCLLAFCVDSGEPVVLRPSRGARYQWINPATRRIEFVDQSNLDRLSPFAYAFYPPLTEPARPIPGALKLCLHGQRGNLVRLLGFGAMAGVMGLFTPVATKLIFDHAVPNRDYSILVQVVLGLMVAAGAAAIYELGWELLMLRIAGIWEHRLVGALWDRIFQLPPGFFRQFSSGELTQRIEVIEEVRDLLASWSIQALLAGVFAGLYFGVMVYFSGVLAMVGLGLVGVAGAISLGCAWAGLSLSRRELVLEGRIHEALIQMVSAIGKLRVAGAEKRAFAYWARRYAEGERLRLKLSGLANIAEVFQSMLPLIGILVIYAVVGLQRPAEVSLGSFLAFLAAFGAFRAAVMELVETGVDGIGLLPFWERSKVVFDQPAEEGPMKRHPGRLRGELDFKNVFFRYDAEGPFTIYDVSFRICPGEFLGIAGPSGCGKSTLLRLMLGFEPPVRGRIYYDRQDLAELDLAQLRRQLGVVLQTSAIFAGSIYENIVCGERVGEGDLERALVGSTFDQVLDELPMGLDTRLSSGGTTLSGGQRQRLLIARALVRRPRILIFDEATSALDNQTQSAILENLHSLAITRILVAHRLNTIRPADRILVLEHGRIQDCGTFDELSRHSATFQSLAAPQQL